MSTNRNEAVFFTSYQNLPLLRLQRLLLSSPPGRCSMFPDLNVITFDGNSVAVYKAASYVVTKLPNETVTVLVQECPADAESPVSRPDLMDLIPATHRFFIFISCFVLSPQLLWNFTNLCLVALNVTHTSNHITINRLQRRVRRAPFLTPPPPPPAAPDPSNVHSVAFSALCQLAVRQTSVQKVWL